MAFLMNQSGKQIVRLSSLWAIPSLTRLLTIVNSNCFSTASTFVSSGGMIQESNPAFNTGMRMPTTAAEYFGRKLKKAILQNKPLPSTDDPDYRKFVDGCQNKESNPENAAFRDLVFNCCAYFVKNVANTMQNKPVASSDDFFKFMDDQFEKLSPLKDPASTIDQAEKNPKATTPEDIKAVADFADTITGGLLRYSPKREFKIKGDNFKFNLDADTDCLHLTVNVSGLPKDRFVVWVVRDRVLVTSKRKVAPHQKVREDIKLPGGHNYDPDEVTGTIMEDGQLKISFPVSKEGGEPGEKYFEVNLV